MNIHFAKISMHFNRGTCGYDTVTQLLTPATPLSNQLIDSDKIIFIYWNSKVQHNIWTSWI